VVALIGILFVASYLGVQSFISFGRPAKRSKRYEVSEAKRSKRS
jgi:hypothetical protein